MRTTAWAIMTCLWIVGTCLLACGDKGSETGSKQRAVEPDPARCEVANLGEAADLFEKSDPPSGRLARVDGLTDPRTLVWKDDADGRIYFITRVMGTGRRLYYMAPVEPGEEPKALSSVTGHIQRWSAMDPKKAAVLAHALEHQYSLKIDPDAAFLITARDKPEGCP